ncbi:hypothetical protein SAMN05216296_1472 [Pseudomonas pohangensis]|uniref:DUF3077 domain-containing protein n=1 Tax=Pseudomonas pohangensis TaxID=364197 RepID=A0A1H2FBK1_9PSED|nr:hypothetical protein [Pseudomonas pohangensis]SDU04760.1 hypothetical protein SAMN05216296_1472 [Pseudomonas pohangensis]
MQQSNSNSSTATAKTDPSIHQRFFTTPEDVLTVPENMPAGYPVDAISCAIARADAMLLLIEGQFDADDGRLADHVIANALWAVRGELAVIGKLVDHGHNTEQETAGKTAAQHI